MKKRKLVTVALALSMIASQSVFAFATDEIENSGAEVMAQDSTQEMLEAGDYAQNQLIVVFNENVSDSRIENIVEQQDAECEEITAVGDDLKVAQVEVGEETALEDAIDSFKDNPKVEYVQPNYKYSFDDTDKYLNPELKASYQYQFDQCNIFEAWDELYKMEKREKVTVAVMDTGVDVKHEDLQANLKYKGSYIRTLSGKRKAYKTDSGEHGTHVSGIIAATYNNGIGGSGVASGYNNDLVDLIVVGTSENGEELYTMDILAALDYCIEEGADVINMSFGAPERDRVMEKAMKHAYDLGIVLMAASGNEDVSDYTSPGSYKEVIAVNATNKRREATYWSNFGVWTDISAPGNNIMSAKPGNEYQLMSGTSMATPVMSGIAALVKIANPSLTPAQIANILYATAAKNEGDAEFTEQIGYGIADAYAAVKAAMDASETVDADSIFTKEASVTVPQYDDISLETLVRPATCLKNVEWSSDDASVATVDDNGKVTGVGAGECTVTAAVGDKSVNIKVKVSEAVKPETITIKDKEYMEDVVVGETFTPSAVITPENATDRAYYFEVSDNKVAGIDDYGDLKIFAPGTFTLTARTASGDAFDSMEVTATLPASEFEIKNGVSTAKVGDTYNYKAIVTTDDGKPTNDKPLWSSTNETVASVDSEKGTVKALKAGVTYIKVDGSCSLYLDGAACASKKLIVGKAKYTAKDIGLAKKAVTYNSATIKWNKIPIASKYVISRSTSKDGTYKTIKTITKASQVSFKDTGLNTGKTYYYKVKAVFRDGSTLGTSSVVSAKPVLKTPTSLTLTAGKGQVKISYSKVAGATGYKICRAVAKTGKYTTVASVKGTSYTNKKLKAGKKYFFKVRAYRTVNGKKVYSKYSVVKSVKVK